jgi:NAD(P)-dependent dehydrogenase (short-subunit alcohol dehydrogenase family)
MTTRIFVTGGASGLGRAIALRYARAGARVCIGDIHDARGREVEALAREVGADALYLHCDVTQEADLERALQLMREHWGGVDIVVNNAGVASAGRIETTPLEDWQWIIDINLLGVVRGCKVFTPQFRRQGHGHFVNVASMAGLMLLPAMDSYNVTKAGVIALSETLRYELEPFNIGVTVVCPSFFNTNLTESLRTHEPGMRSHMERLLSRSSVTAADIAEQTFHAVRQRKYLVLTHAYPRFAWYFKRLLPFLYRQYITRSARKLMPKLVQQSLASRS